MFFVVFFPQKLTSSRSNTPAPGGTGRPQDWVGEWELVGGYQTRQEGRTSTVETQEGLRGDHSPAAQP